MREAKLLAARLLLGRVRKRFVGRRGDVQPLLLHFEPQEGDRAQPLGSWPSRDSQARTGLGSAAVPCVGQRVAGSCGGRMRLLLAAPRLLASPAAAALCHGPRLPPTAPCRGAPRRWGSSFNVPPSAEFVARPVGICSMLRLPVRASAEGLDAAFVGVPLDTGTSNRPGAR